MHPLNEVVVFSAWQCIHWKWKIIQKNTWILVNLSRFLNIRPMVKIFHLHVSVLRKFFYKWKCICPFVESRTAQLCICCTAWVYDLYSAPYHHLDTSLWGSKSSQLVLCEIHLPVTMFLIFIQKVLFASPHNLISKGFGMSLILPNGYEIKSHKASSFNVCVYSVPFYLERNHQQKLCNSLDKINVPFN